MADFYQTGVVTTLHRLTSNSIERLEADLEKFSRNKPIGLVLPALYSEFETLAMQRIVSELRKVAAKARVEAKSILLFDGDLSDETLAELASGIGHDEVWTVDEVLAELRVDDEPVELDPVGYRRGGLLALASPGT